MSQQAVIDLHGASLATDGLFIEVLQQERLFPVFQPIVDLATGHTLGYEALIRGPEGSPLHLPDALFETATRLALLGELERVCRRLSIRCFAKLGLDSQLFLNISPSVLISLESGRDQLLAGIAESGMRPERIVLELAEHQRVVDFSLLRRHVDVYRQAGFRMALDDLGAGYAGLRLWAELLPDFIKIDKHFIRGIQGDGIKSGILAGLCRTAAATECRLIAEGIETAEELAAVRRFGIGLGQGYFFARPCREPEGNIFTLPVVAPGQQTDRSDDLYRIALRVEPLNATLKVQQVVDYLQKRPQQQLLPIVDRGRPLGLINRHLFFNKLMATRFGLDLYGKSPISRLLEDSLIEVDLHADLESVSRRITATPVPEQAFIVTCEGKYYGVATVLDLLEVITEQKVRSAMHANPLTLLPGLVPMNQHINAALAARAPFAVLYFDLDNFKPYNDCYGYEAGDELIHLLADLLRRFYPEPMARVGHIGGDDFIVVDYQQDPQARAWQLLDEFLQRVPSHYSEEHVRQGGIEGTDRSGRGTFFGLVSVSVGLVPAEALNGCISHIEVADLATEAKSQAKRANGNSCFVNRRGRSVDAAVGASSQSAVLHSGLVR